MHVPCFQSIPCRTAAMSLVQRDGVALYVITCHCMSSRVSTYVAVSTHTTPLHWNEASHSTNLTPSNVQLWCRWMLLRPPPPLSSPSLSLLGHTYLVWPHSGNRRWMLLGVVGCCWVSLDVVGCHLDVVGCRWLLLEAAGGKETMWSLLMDACCVARSVRDL